MRACPSTRASLAMGMSYRYLRTYIPIKNGLIIAVISQHLDALLQEVGSGRHSLGRLRSGGRE